MERGKERERKRAKGYDENGIIYSGECNKKREEVGISSDFYMQKCKKTVSQYAKKILQ